MSNKEEFDVTSSEASEFLGVSRQVLYYWRQTQQHLAFSAGTNGRYYYRRKDLKKFIKKMARKERIVLPK